MPHRREGDDAARPGFVRRYVDFLARHHLIIVLGAFALFLGGAALSSRLQLRADFTQLLPQNDPELKQLQAISDRVGAPATLVVAVEGNDPKANERFADALAKNLQPLVGRDLRSIDYRADAAKGFFEHNKALYASLADLKRIDDDFAKILREKKNPAYVPFANPDLGEVEDDPEDDLEKLKAEEQKRADAATHFPSGYYESQDRRLLAMITWTKSSGTGDLSGFRIRDDVHAAIARTNPAAHGVQAEITGDVESAIEEHDALKSDIEIVSLVCTVLVLLVIVLYYRSILSLSDIFFPTLTGVALAFGITALAIGYLNTNTAFLGSIILGNGINFGIILLARYREDRAGGAEVEDALGSAIARTAQPTLAAALAAGIAYGSLGLTRFRGFQQFGFVGGIGMVLCWLFTYSHCPALILTWERVRGRKTSRRAPGTGRVLVAISSFLLRRRGPVLAVAAVATAAASVTVVRFVAHNPFEYDFSKLRNQESRKHGAGDLYVRVGRIFPQDISPIAVALLPTVNDARPYHDALLEKDCAEAERRAGSALARDPVRLAAECRRRVEAGEPTGGILSVVSTVYDVLPKDQAAKLQAIADLRRRLEDPAMSLLSADEHEQVDQWAPPADLHALGPQDLPESVARRWRELDGTVGRVALVFPIRGFKGWDGHNLLRLSDLLKAVRLPDGDVISAVGHSSLFAAMLRSIAHDGPIATEAALLGVLVMVVVLFRRPRPVALVLLSLVVGVVWMAGAGAAFGLKLNFLNFVALPITLGIGVDYAVNVYARLAREPFERHAVSLAETGSAVALCSSTTIIGYSSLLIASNGALRSFGKLADLGELGCILAALLIVPATVRLVMRDVSSGGS